MPELIRHQPRIAVVLPVAYRGGTLRAAKLIAEAIWIGSRNAGEPVNVVLAYPETRETYPESWSDDLLSTIARRSFVWEELDRETSRRAMRYAGHRDWSPLADTYLAVQDSIQHLCDCDLWVIVSDRLHRPLLPLRPYLMVVYDYVQRYNSGFPEGTDDAYLAAARSAARVLVSTKLTEQDALHYAGIPREKVFRVPNLVPLFESLPAPVPAPEAPYFLWTTNRAVHKNQYGALLALREYYESLDGRLDCRVTGFGTGNLLKGDAPHLEALPAIVSNSAALTERLRLLGELPDSAYRRELAGAAFLWHPARVDNGTFCVVEAASLGVPSLSSNYPAMQEMDQVFELNVTWMDAADPADMARRLKQMESTAAAARRRLPGPGALAEHSVAKLACHYWKVIRECL